METADHCRGRRRRPGVSPGRFDNAYYDEVPDWQYGGFFLFSLETNPSIQLDKLYGEAGSSDNDTLTLTVSLDILNNDPDTFYIGLLTNDIESPLVPIPVRIKKTAVSNIVIFQDQHVTIRNIPNPFYLSTTISYSLNESSNVMLSVFNVSGQLIKKLVNTWQYPGDYYVIWDGTDESGSVAKPGLYFCLLSAGKTTNKTKMVRIE